MPNHHLLKAISELSNCLDLIPELLLVDARNHLIQKLFNIDDFFGNLWQKTIIFIVLAMMTQILEMMTQILVNDDTNLRNDDTNCLGVELNRLKLILQVILGTT